MIDTSPNKRPALAFSSTADDDDSQGTPNSNNPLVDRQAIAYLLRYETMVRQQEAEHMATLAHLRPFLNHHLATTTSTTTTTTTSIKEQTDFLQQEISFGQIQQALMQLETSPHAYMQTDRQLVMVLKTMTQKVLKSKTVKELDAQTITWAEFLQCYQTVIAGMQTLQHVTDPKHRGRVKDRTLSMISLFEPPATKLLGNSSIPREVGGDDMEQVSQDGSHVDAVMRKKLLYAVLGAVVGAVVMFSTTSYLAPAAPLITVTTTRSNPPPQECKKTIEYIEKKIYVPMEPKPASLFTPSVSPAVMTTKKLTTKPRSSPYLKLHHQQQQNADSTTTQNNNSAAMSAAVGGAAGMMVAPIVWTAISRLPALGAGGWSIVTVAGVALLQGLIHTLGGLVQKVMAKK
jgi:hypothetical protein